MASNRSSIEPLIHGFLLRLAFIHWIWSPLRCLASLRPHVRSAKTITQYVYKSCELYSYYFSFKNLMICSYPCKVWIELTLNCKYILTINLNTGQNQINQRIDGRDSVTRSAYTDQNSQSDSRKKRFSRLLRYKKCYWSFNWFNLLSFRKDGELRY